MKKSWYQENKSCLNLDVLLSQILKFDNQTGSKFIPRENEGI